MSLYDKKDSENLNSMLKDSLPAYRLNKDSYTIEDIYAMPEDVRVELIDGKLFYMTAPTRTHQRIIGELYLATANFIRSRNGDCEVYIPPFGVDLMEDHSVYLEPDLTVVCDTTKLDERGCHGAPDWVVEVLSPSSRKKDSVIKLGKYREAGVREYWIVYPDKRMVLVYGFQEEDEDMMMYSFDDEIQSLIFPELVVRLGEYV